MTQSLPPLPQKPSRSGRPPLVPPEEQFWQRYSPHHEFPLSTTTSVVLHALIFGLLVLLAYVLFVPDDSQKQPPKVDVKVVPGEVGVKPLPGPGSGGGNPLGVGNEPGGKDKAVKTEVGNGKNEGPVGNSKDPKIKLKDIKVKPLDVTTDPKGGRT